jgi:hypothetical protein
MYLKLKNSTLAILNIMDLFSKFAYSRSFVLPKNSQAIPSKHSMDLFNDFLNEVNEKYPKYKIGFIVTDRGSEF